jgi:hypothetical protein
VHDASCDINAENVLEHSVVTDRDAESSCDTKNNHDEFTRDFRLPPQRRLDLRSSGILRSVEWFRDNLSVPYSRFKKLSS